MATLKDAEKLAGQLTELSQTLANELSNGEADFSRMTEIAGEIREQADALASTFSTVDEALSQHLTESLGRKTPVGSGTKSEE